MWAQVRRQKLPGIPGSWDQGGIPDCSQNPPESSAEIAIRLPFSLGEEGPLRIQFQGLLRQSAAKFLKNCTFRPKNPGKSADADLRPQARLETFEEGRF